MTKDQRHWTKMWTTEHSMFSVFLFAEELTRYCPKIIGGGLSEVYFIINKRLVTNYKDEGEHTRFSQYLAGRSLNEKDFPVYITKKLYDLNNGFKNILKRSKNDIMNLDFINEFICLHHELPSCTLTVTWAPNEFQNIDAPKDVKDRVYELYNKSRKDTENLYSDIEKFLAGYFSHIAKDTGYSLNDIWMFSKDELVEYFENGLLPDQAKLRQRFKGTGVYATEYVTEFKTVEETLNDLCLSNEDSENVIKGNIVFPGLIKGKVKKVFDTTDDIEDGDILVTAMTRPEWASILAKAGAIITDAGGILSHAAIVAREMKKPCIIGTKIATKVLNDGDLVEVDANIGLIRILNK